MALAEPMANEVLQPMDLTTLRAVVADLRQEIVPSRFEKAQQPDSSTLNIGLRTLKGLIWLELSWQAEAPRLVTITTPIRSRSQSTLAQQIQCSLSQGHVQIKRKVVFLYVENEIRFLMLLSEYDMR